MAGRFTSRDRIGLWGDAINLGNGLAYVGNSPWTRIDPYGLAFLDWVQGGLDVAGLVPGFGEVADGANALISVARGNYGEAAMSAAAMIPFAGWGATAAKAANKAADALKAGEKALDAAKKAEKIGDGVKAAKKVGGSAAKGATESHHLLPKAKEFRKFFDKAGLDVEDFKIPLTKGKHRLKPDGLHTGPENWNKLWRDFFKKNPEATKGEILEQLERMRGSCGA